MGNLTRHVSDHLLRDVILVTYLAVHDLWQEHDSTSCYAVKGG